MRRSVVNRQGTYATIFGITASVMFGFTALGVDVGYHRVAMVQLGNAADAGAHAGAIELDGTDDGVTAAIARAVAVTNANQMHGTYLTITSTDVDVGRYDSDNENGCTLAEGCWTLKDGTPVGYDEPQPDVTSSDTNAVLVGLERMVPTSFAQMMGKSEIQAANYAIARLPIVEGEGVPCAFPMSLPECSMADWTGGNPCGKLIRMRRSSSNADNMAWSRADGQPASIIKEAIATVDGECSNAYQEEDVDTTLQNGEVASAMDIISAQLAGTNNYNVGGVGRFDYGDDIDPGWDSTWGNCPTGNVSDYCDSTDNGDACPDSLPPCAALGNVAATQRMIKRSVSVFEETGYTCDSNGNVTADGNYNDTVETTGFVNIVIYNAYDVSTGPQANRDKYMDAYISCTDEDGNLREPDDDGNQVIHQGDDEPEIEPPEEGNLAFVE